MKNDEEMVIQKWQYDNKTIIMFVTMSYYHNYLTETIFIEYDLSVIIIIWL